MQNCPSLPIFRDPPRYLLNRCCVRFCEPSWWVSQKSAHGEKTCRRRQSRTEPGLAQNKGNNMILRYIHHRSHHLLFVSRIQRWEMVMVGVASFLFIFFISSLMLYDGGNSDPWLTAFVIACAVVAVFAPPSKVVNSISGSAVVRKRKFFSMF